MARVAQPTSFKERFSGFVGAIALQRLVWNREITHTGGKFALLFLGFIDDMMSGN